MQCQTANDEHQCHEKGKIYIIKSQAGKVTGGGTVMQSVGEHMQDQKMEPGDEMHSM